MKVYNRYYVGMTKIITLSLVITDIYYILTCYKVNNNTKAELKCKLYWKWLSCLNEIEGQLFESNHNVLHKDSIQLFAVIWQSNRIK